MSDFAWRYTWSWMVYGIYVYDHPNWNRPGAAYQMAMEIIAMEAVKPGLYP